MAAPRFYCPIPLAPNCALDLPDDLAHYAGRVLRLRDGAAVVLFDGSGGEYPAHLRIESKRVAAHLGAHVAREAELAGCITLVQGLPSGDKMDWVIEKAVELGVQKIVPIAADRSVLQLQGERLAKRMTHWR
ncbi:MAG: 16S rRNA (uracil(1498)-N(3))-methyltransferase, partial [Burkholderiaceae bacterium]|nr:16S rRNA (uracil(1498)-N(3))-methyltransferase [Burkholderiaceae bacterium]